MPDETARVPVERYVNPHRATWPAADFIVGNPPFIGAGWMRTALGDGYAEAVRAAWPEVPESADFVMYWWHQAATLVQRGAVRRFGFITTNSLRQTFNRRVVAGHLGQNQTPLRTPLCKEGRTLRFDSPLLKGGWRGAPGAFALSLAFAIPDHPWVDASDGAAVRIAMSVGVAGETPGRLWTVAHEGGADGDAVKVQFGERRGLINADLTIGANVAGALPLRANPAI